MAKLIYSVCCSNRKGIFWQCIGGQDRDSENHFMASVHVNLR